MRPLWSRGGGRRPDPRFEGAAKKAVGVAIFLLGMVVLGTFLIELASERFSDSSVTDAQLMWWLVQRWWWWGCAVGLCAGGFFLAHPKD